MTRVSAEPASKPQRRHAHGQLRARQSRCRSESGSRGLRRLPAPAEATFDGIKILTAPGVVMTPVPTTEALVRWAAEWIDSRSVRLADVGTGSGAVAVALALRAPAAGIWATDDSEQAVALARSNVARHGLEERVQVLLGDLLDPVPGELDLVVANLPYHAEARARGSAECACSDQPAHAIYAPGDGLGYYRELLEACRTRLKGGGALAIQLYGSVLAAGHGQLDQLAHEIEIRAHAGWESHVAAGPGEKRRRWSA
jgi:HemK-like putative methylase